MITIDPRGMDAVRWAAQTGLLLGAQGGVPYLRDPSRWREWARQVIVLPAVAAVVPPAPDRFADWSLWAFQFNLAVAAL